MTKIISRTTLRILGLFLTWSTRFGSTRSQVIQPSPEPLTLQYSQAQYRDMDCATVLSDRTINNSRQQHVCMCQFLRDAQPPDRSLSSFGRSQAVSCINGFVTVPGEQNDIAYPCRDMELLAFLPIVEMTGVGNELGLVNDVWGDTLPNGREIAIVGMEYHTAFVDVTDPTDSFFVGYVNLLAGWHGFMGSLNFSCSLFGNQLPSRPWWSILLAGHENIQPPRLYRFGKSCAGTTNLGLGNVE